MTGQLSKTGFTALLILALMLPAAPALGDTLYVPGQYATIQAAIDAATNPGDVVEIADGTYTGAGNKNLDFGGMAITVRSANGPDGCTIDCQGSGRGFYFHTGEGPDSIVEGLTIRNGDLTDSGGGIYCNGSSPTIRDCVITDNQAPYRGGGVCCFSGSPAFSRCVISNNLVTGGSYNFGGALYCYDGDPTLTDCAIVGNSATSTSADGGGIYCIFASLTMTNCVIYGNAAERDGGGVHLDGYMIWTFINCTFSANTANDQGGAIWYGDTGPMVTNCILWGDTPQEIYASGVTATVTYCDVQGNWGDPNDHNIDADPLFVDADGPDGDPNTWSDNDYHLGAGSPCIDAANNVAVPPEVTTDLDGDPRFVDDPDTPDTGVGDPPIVDMGAYEYQVGGCPGDVNGDDQTNISDLAELLAAYNTCPGDAGYNPACNLYEDDPPDGCVNLSDLAFLLADYGCPD